ncbi:hypothetical protein [Amycolatopsis australiensis]|uniref:Uncharacterized protein n=1 Tax=Amycolatopsis australiensis TaxID=546364 RepID=A0A1K1QMN3_9PSEU|nr:hypothetical protein [Amycolatopsis australiensis]SFW60883.1 hypothetical protein SAMN04489730_1972 [Amycolatopsis australiensis]
MLWLFGQIWLWLIVAFLLGALTSWLVLRGARRPQARPEPVEEARHEPEPEPLAAEQTQFIPAAWAQHEPSRIEHAHDDEEPEPVGHREGHLPLPPQRGAEAEDWPTEDEPAWPESEEAAPPWPHQPGRGG